MPFTVEQQFRMHMRHQMPWASNALAVFAAELAVQGVEYHNAALRCAATNQPDFVTEFMEWRSELMAYASCYVAWYGREGPMS